jgi:ribonuclease VapC
MIVVDTSALMTVLLREPKAGVCLDALEIEDEIAISVGTLAELFVVAAGRGISGHAADLVERAEIDVIAVTEGAARRVGEAYARWGKGIHPANLNFGDCFAYALAKERGCPLLYVGDDFAKTDVKSAL